MELKDQVSNAELSNKIKKLGITAPSLFFREWTGAKDSEVESWGGGHSYYGIDNVNCYTVAELGELLPHIIKHKFVLRMWKNENGYFIDYLDAYTDKSFSFPEIFSFHSDKNEANARAKMLIYLLENKLTNPHEE